MLEFTDKEFEAIIQECNFNNELLEIAIMIHKRYSRAKMLIELRDKNLATSERTLDRNIRKVKEKMYKILKNTYFYKRNN